MTQYTYRIDPRPPKLGGGWRLHLLQDGAEVGGGVFPPADDADPDVALTRAHADALAEAETWLGAQEQGEDIPPRK